MSYNRGDVVILAFPFVTTDGTRQKKTGARQETRQETNQGVNPFRIDYKKRVTFSASRLFH